MLEEIDVAELAWFLCCMLTVTSIVFVLCGTVELIERYDLFKASKIQKEVSTSPYS